MSKKWKVFNLAPGYKPIDVGKDRAWGTIYLLGGTAILAILSAAISVVVR